MDSKTFVVTGGGTGGHIYPGLALLQQVKRDHPGWKVYFVGATGGLEEKIVTKSDVPLHLIPVGRLHRSVGRFRQLVSLLKMPFSLLMAVILFWKIRPHYVVGVGGFASGPFVLIAWLFGAKTALWEANAMPGVANRYLSKLITRSYVVFPEAKKYLHSRVVKAVGMPVRKEFFDIPKKNRLPRKPLRVLVFGGSQGARGINTEVVKLFQEFPLLLEQLEVCHQIGSRDYKKVMSDYGDLTKKIEVCEYIHDMAEKFAWADLIICRSGASTVAEVITAKTPALFVPLPTAADNHQLKNAEVLMEKKAAVLVEQKDLTPNRLKQELEGFIKSPESLVSYSSALEAFDFSEASEKLIGHLLTKD